MALKVPRHVHLILFLNTVCLSLSNIDNNETLEKPEETEKETENSVNPEQANSQVTATITATG